MRQICIVLLALIVLALAPAGVRANAAPLATKQVTLARKGPHYTLSIKYIQAGVPAIDTEIAAWAKKAADDFAAYVKSDWAGDDAWTLDIQCKVARNDAQMFEVLCNHQMMDDGNHTHVTFTTFNYVMPAARRVFVAEVVMPAAYAKVRAYAAAHMVSEDPEFDADVLNGALGPQEDTFAAFIIQPATVTFYFTPDQLQEMTSAGGHTVVPMTELKGLVRTDWLAPQPSFDCAKAATAVEKAICSDVALARLDRAMAARYRDWPGYADNNPAEIARYKTDQQAWLAARGKTCPGAPGAAVACLTRVYQKRIDEMKNPLH